MQEKVLQTILSLLNIYLLVGLFFALFFVSFIVPRIDPAAKNSGIAFRLIILPGSTALWPILILYWIKGNFRKITKDDDETHL